MSPDLQAPVPQDPESLIASQGLTPRVPIWGAQLWGSLHPRGAQSFASLSGVPEPPTVPLEAETVYTPRAICTKGGATW